jgi:effector-binding domain-containing protein
MHTLSLAYKRLFEFLARMSGKILGPQAVEVNEKI